MGVCFVKSIGAQKRALGLDWGMNGLGFGLYYDDFFFFSFFLFFAFGIGFWVSWMVG